jgi:hypothetical protein
MQRFRFRESNPHSKPDRRRERCFRQSAAQRLHPKRYNVRKNQNYIAAYTIWGMKKNSPFNTNKTFSLLSIKVKFVLLMVNFKHGNTQIHAAIDSLALEMLSPIHRSVADNLCKE